MIVGVIVLIVLQFLGPLNVESVWVYVFIPLHYELLTFDTALPNDASWTSVSAARRGYWLLDAVF